MPRRRKMWLNYDHTQIKAKRATRRNLRTLRVVRGADGWLIEEDHGGRKRRSTQTWSTFADATSAIADGYQLPPIAQHLTELPAHYVIRGASPLRVKGGRVCFWCERDGRQVPAEFTVLITFGRSKKLSMSCCDTIAHGLYHGAHLDLQMNPLPEEDTE